jgi:Protein of unknown function (DUF2911)
MCRATSFTRTVCSGALGLIVAVSNATAQGAVPACGMRGAERWQSTRPSPLDSAAVVVHGRLALICYSRPSARGRSVDSLIPFGLAWRTGANEPTTITLTGKLSVGGAVLDAGRYVLLTVPGPGQWRLVFNTTPDTEPAKMFKSLRRIAVGTGRVEALREPIEEFTIRAVPDSAAPDFLLEWGTRRVRVPVRPSP